MVETIAVNKTQANASSMVLNHQSNHIALNPQLALRPYQAESLSQVEKAYKRGNNRLLVSLPTGTGFCFVINVYYIHKALYNN